MSDAVPTDEHGNAVETLDTLAGKVNGFLAQASKADQRSIDMRLSAGQLLLSAKNRIDTGNEKDPDGKPIKWREWAEKNIKRSRTDIYRLLKIMQSDDPAKALADERRITRERVAQIRGQTGDAKDETVSRSTEQNSGSAAPGNQQPTVHFASHAEADARLAEIDQELDRQQLEPIKRVILKLSPEQQSELFYWLEARILAGPEPAQPVEAPKTEPEADASKRLDELLAEWHKIDGKASRGLAIRWIEADCPTAFEPIDNFVTYREKLAAFRALATHTSDDDALEQFVKTARHELAQPELEAAQ